MSAWACPGIRPRRCGSRRRSLSLLNPDSRCGSWLPNCSLGDTVARPPEAPLDDQLETGTAPVLQGVAVPNGSRLRLDFWYVNPHGFEPRGPRPIRASMGSSVRASGGGVWWPGEMDVRAPFQRWSWYLDATGQPVRQEVNERPWIVPYEPTWPPSDKKQQAWLSFRLGRGHDQWLRWPLFLTTTEDGVVRRVLPRAVLQTVVFPENMLPEPVRLGPVTLAGRYAGQGDYRARVLGQGRCTPLDSRSRYLQAMGGSSGASRADFPGATRSTAGRAALALVV